MLRDFVIKRREELGLSQGQLAKLAGIARPNISKIENGQIELPGRKVLEGLAKVFEIDISVLNELAKGNNPDDISIIEQESVPIDRFLKVHFPERTFSREEKILLENYTAEMLQLFIKYHFK